MSKEKMEVTMCDLKQDRKRKADNLTSRDSKSSFQISRENPRQPQNVLLKWSFNHGKAGRPVTSISENKKMSK